MANEENTNEETAPSAASETAQAETEASAPAPEATTETADAPATADAEAATAGPVPATRPPYQGQQTAGRRFAGPGGGKRFPRRKVCAFCVDKLEYIDYKDTKRIRKFMTERGKILPRRITGNCAAHQRMLTVAIKRARIVALVPFKSE